MNHHEEFDSNFRTAVDAVVVPPVRWTRVEKRARRLRVFAVVGLAAAVAALTVTVAAVFVLGKKAADPTYLSSATTSVGFGAASAQQGGILLGGYLRSVGLPAGGLAKARLREQGFVFSARVTLKGFLNRRLFVHWSVQPADASLTPPVTTYANPAVIIPSSRTISKTVEAWISYPPQPGRYVANFTLVSSKGAMLSQSRSRPFVVSGPRVATPYRAPGYEALLPNGWKFEERYVHASKGRYVTRMVGPGGLSVLIDTTLNFHGDPVRSASFLANNWQGVPGYKRVEFRRIALVGLHAVEWSYDINGERITDILFDDGPDGYGVAARGPEASASEVRTVAREVTRSLTSLRR